MSNLQARETRQISEVLERHFAGRVVEVSFAESIRYDIEDGRRAIQPDVFVVLDVPSRVRDSYRPWKEGKAPSWVVEVASESTAEVDRTDKLTVYHALEVPEVFLFDPAWLCHKEILMGFSFSPDGYRRIEPEPGTGRVASDVLGLLLEAEAYVEDKVRYWRLRFVDPATGVRLPTTDEILRANRQLLKDKDEIIRELKRRLGEV